MKLELVLKDVNQDTKGIAVKKSVIIISTEEIAALDVGIASTMSNAITLMEPAGTDALKVSRVPTVLKVNRGELLEGNATKLAAVTAKIGVCVKKIQVTVLMDVQQDGRVTFATKVHESLNSAFVSMNNFF